MVHQETGDQDLLTGLIARKAFDERYRQEVARAAKQGGMLSLAFIDIDFFKAFNDEHGHAAGDQCIQRVAEAIRKTTGSAGQSARYGGEEFAVLLPGMEKEQAFLLVERIRAAMECPSGEVAQSGQTAARLTVSGGVAAFPADGRSPSEIIRKADHALYRAKSTGRNKVCIAQDERMATKTTHFTVTQLERLAALSKDEGIGEAVLLREALDDLLFKYRVSDVES